MKKITAISMIFIMTLFLISCSANEKAASGANSAAPGASAAESSEKPSGTPAATPAATPTPEPSKTPDATPPPADTPKTDNTDYSGKKLVALTFDDGPDLQTTPLVLDKLEKYGVVASFFLIGKYVDESTKPVMERQLKLGCEINNHSWSHQTMSQMSKDQIKEEIQKTSDIINKMAGVTPKFFRPPFIAVNSDMYENIDLPFICGINCTDWDSTVTAEKRAETILATVKDGDIILMHDFSGNNNTVNALDTIIPGLLDKGYAFVTVSKLFELKGIDPNQEYKMWTNTGD